MMFSKISRRLFPASFCTVLISLFAASSAQAIDISVSWTGDGGNTVTGTLTGTDSNGNNIIEGAFGGTNEWTLTSFFTFSDNTNAPVTYTVGNLLAFGNYYGTGNGFRFNYDTISGTVLNQTSDPSSGVGVSIGDPINGYGLESSPVLLTFNDNINFNNDNSDPLTNPITATPVPFESDASAIFISVGSLFALHQWRKKRKNSLVKSEK